MKFATLSALFLTACGHAVLTTTVMADGRGHGSMGMSRGGGQHSSPMQFHAPSGMMGGGTRNMKLPGGTVQNNSNQNSIARNVGKFPVQSGGVQVAPRTPGFKPPVKLLGGVGNGSGSGYKKPIDLGIGNGKPPMIDPGFGKKPIDPGFGKGPVIKKPIDLGIGNGKPVISPIGGKHPIDIGVVKDPGFKKPIDLGVGKGNGTVKIDPDLIGKIKIKTPMLPFNPGIKIPVTPKIPICPPFPYPHKPHHCPPCPPIFFGWSWFPGFGNCYGYTGGLCLPAVTTVPMIAQLPMVDTLPEGALPQIVPGTTVVATVTGAGNTAGRVMMQYNAVALMAEVQKWEGDKVTFVVPAVALQEPVPVKLVFLRADGEMVQEVNAELVAATVEQQP